MKMIISAIAVLCVSTLAQAMPAIGDTANFAGTMSDQQGRTAQIQVTFAVTQFDASKNAYEVTQTIATSSKSQTDATWQNAADMMTDAGIADILTNCQRYGGTLEAVTVAAGAYDTCRLVQDGSTYNAAVGVPFGLVKIVQPNVQLDLVSFQSGQ